MVDDLRLKCTKEDEEKSRIQDAKNKAIAMNCTHRCFCLAMQVATLVLCSRMCFAQNRELCVLHFKQELSEPFLSDNEPFKNDIALFNEELLRELGQSKSLTVSFNIRDSKKTGAGASTLMGRISDDTSNFVYIDAEICRAAENGRHDPSLERFRIEASPAEAFLVKQRLMSYLIDKLVLEVEARQ